MMMIVMHGTSISLSRMIRWIYPSLARSLSKATVHGREESRGDMLLYLYWNFVLCNHPSSSFPILPRVSQRKNRSPKEIVPLCYHLDIRQLLKGEEEEEEEEEEVVHEDLDFASPVAAAATKLWLKPLQTLSSSASLTSLDSRRIEPTQTD
jgi:hypothetical protein